MERERLFAEIKRRLSEAYGDRLKKVVIYGSEARGEAEPDSDIDVMVVLEGEVKLLDEIARSTNAVYPLVLETGRPIHPDPVSAETYETCDYSLYRAVRAEGIAL